MTQMTPIARGVICVIVLCICVICGSTQAGQRLATMDNGTGVFGLWGVSTWTAAGQLYYSMTPETATGPYDHVWNWYDGSGRRFMTQLSTTLDRSLSTVSPTSGGFRTYYVYDGNDVAFTLVRPSTGTTWRIQQRYVNTGLDENVAARLWLNGTPTSLALVTDRQGGYIMGVKADGSEETRTGFYLRNAFGKMESGSTAASSMETHTGLGFAGAGTPTAAGGGYVYMRNRWYDPQTGRFLSQDPIGLAGGVNLYAYAGNNPAAYTDPFGLCPPAWMCQLMTSFVVNHPRAAEAIGTLIDQEAAGFACGAQAFHNCEVPPSGTAGALAGQLTLAFSVRAPIGGATAAGAEGGAAAARWTLGSGKSAAKWANRMQKRGWTGAQITEAMESGEQFAAPNLVNRGHSATRYVHPTTGRSVVVDDVTHEVIHVGGDGFKY